MEIKISKSHFYQILAILTTFHCVLGIHAFQFNAHFFLLRPEIRTKILSHIASAVAQLFFSNIQRFLQTVLHLIEFLFEQTHKSMGHLLYGFVNYSWLLNVCRIWRLIFITICNTIKKNQRMDLFQIRELNRYSRKINTKSYSISMVLSAVITSGEN